MKRQFSNTGQYSFIEADIDESRCYGVGGHHSPRLSIYIELNIAHGHMKPDEGIAFRRLNVRLCIAPGQVLTEGGADLVQLIAKDYNTTKIYLTLEFQLDAARFTALEKIRAGGNLKLRLEGILIADHLRNLGLNSAPIQRAVWGYVERWSGLLAEELTIPRDVWVSRVLPQVGYGVIHLLEFPVVPIEACQELKHSFEALCQAQERHKIGLYDDAVGKCRVALDPFFELIEKADAKGVVRRVPELPRSWQSKMGEATYAWLVGMFGAIREAGNPNHHTPKAHYDLLESQMILGITAAVLAFVARTRVTEGK